MELDNILSCFNYRDPIPFPEKARKPLTDVQEFNLHVDHRAVDRAEFDKNIKEKEMMYKRYREEAESAKLMEEEKALKQLRRTLVPHTRPVPSFDHPFVPQNNKAKVPKIANNSKERNEKNGLPSDKSNSGTCLGIGLLVLHQLTGINGVLFYSSNIFISAVLDVERHCL